MSAPRISAQEQQELRNNAKKELERLETCLKDQRTVQLVDEFKNKFNVCETVYKVILAEHQKAKNKPTDKKRLKLDMRQVPQALKFAGYKFDKEDLEVLFGSPSKILSNEGKTAKTLRDEVTHGMNKKAVEEIIARESELFRYMDAFLDEFRNIDSIK